MLAEALAVDPALAEGGRKNSLRVARGSVVRVVLLPSDDPAAFRVEGGAAEDEIEWEGDVANATVSAVCLPTCPPGRHMLSVAVVREGGARPAKLRFAVRVGEQGLDAASPPPTAPLAPWSAGIRNADRSPSITSVASDEQELVEIGPYDDDALFFEEVVRRARHVRAERRQAPLEVRVLRRIPWQDLRADDRPAIGRGCFGSVIKGEYRGVPVAVKQMRSDKVTEEAFVREAALAASAGGHPHVLGLIGVQARSPLYRIVMPYTPLGSVEGALVAPVRRLREPGSGIPAGWPFWGGHVPGEQRNAGLAALSAFPSEPVPDGCTAAALEGGHAAGGAPALDWGGALLLLRQVASALEHLHAIGIVHGDVAARNVLLDSPSHALVGDFGLADVSASLVTEEARMAQRMRVMPLRYSSPELLLRGELTPASDVYAFGMLCFEVLVCEQPWAAVESSQEVAAKALSGLRPRFPPQFPRPAVALILRCWQADPASRPTICAIRQDLDALAAAAGVELHGGDRDGAEQPCFASYASYIAL